MKRVIYYYLQNVLLYKQARELIFSSGENQTLSLEKNIISFNILSYPSSVMRMCCCSMSC